MAGKDSTQRDTAVTPTFRAAFVCDLFDISTTTTRDMIRWEEEENHMARQAAPTIRWRKDYPSRTELRKLTSTEKHIARLHPINLRGVMDTRYGYRRVLAFADCEHGFIMMSVICDEGTLNVPIGRSGARRLAEALIMAADKIDVVDA
jgi:hypothetical protein